jgi:hypothetical protein
VHREVGVWHESAQWFRNAFPLCLAASNHPHVPLAVVVNSIVDYSTHTPFGYEVIETAHALAYFCLCLYRLTERRHDGHLILSAVVRVNAGVLRVLHVQRDVFRKLLVFEGCVQARHLFHRHCSAKDVIKEFDEERDKHLDVSSLQHGERGATLVNCSIQIEHGLVWHTAA